MITLMHKFLCTWFQRCVVGWRELIPYQLCERANSCARSQYTYLGYESINKYDDMSQNVPSILTRNWAEWGYLIKGFNALDPMFSMWPCKQVSHIQLCENFIFTLSVIKYWLGAGCFFFFFFFNFVMLLNRWWSSGRMNV
jgi:hypothetical protein